MIFLKIKIPVDGRKDVHIQKGKNQRSSEDNTL